MKREEKARTAARSARDTRGARGPCPTGTRGCAPGIAEAVSGARSRTCWLSLRLRPRHAKRAGDVELWVAYKKVRTRLMTGGRYTNLDSSGISEDLAAAI